MNTRSTISLITVGIAACFACCMAAPSWAGGRHAHVAATAAYVDMYDYLSTWRQQDAWLDTQYGLQADFNDVCGDTFCEGDYNNIEALSYRCSVEATTGYVKECVWTFAASQETINADNGKVQVEPRIWQCASPIAPSTGAEELAEALDTAHPMDTPLPHTDKTLYDGLADNCL